MTPSTIFSARSTSPPKSLWPGRVHDVDLDVVVEDGRVLGEDGDAALALQLVGVHHALDVGLVGAKGAALVQHGIHQRGLAVVHVRDDGDIAKTLAQNNCPSC